MMATADVLATTSTVRRQYEEFPFPERSPEDEAHRLFATRMDDLPTLNFYCFRGRRDFRNGFRALVAGGGTGDSTIYLAEQLRGTDATVVHLDLSGQSIEIAKKRAAARGLEENVRWIQGSLLDFPDSHHPEPFDYINCSGVLHHMHNPQEGLQALKAVLKEDGAMGLMLYGKYGRTGVDQMQQLMGLVNRNTDDSAAMIANTRTIIDSLPKTNWFKRSADLTRLDYHSNDAWCYDQFLHSTDQPFNVREIYELLDEAELHLVEYLPGARALYDPKMVFRDPDLLERVQELPRPLQQTAAELFWGTIDRHEFWASAVQESFANFDDPENVPFFSRVGVVSNVRESLLNNTEDQWSLAVENPGGITLHLTLEFSEVIRKFVELVDGHRTIGEILEGIANAGGLTAESVEEIHSTCLVVFEILRSNDLMSLRHKSIPAYHLR